MGIAVALDLDQVIDAVIVAVRAVWIGAQPQFLKIADAVAVSVD